MKKEKENKEKENKEKETEKKIKELIEKMRPFLMNDGGDIEFVEYSDNIVYIKLSGACANCEYIDITIKEGIEEMLITEIPEIKGVINL